MPPFRPFRSRALCTALAAFSAACIAPAFCAETASAAKPAPADTGWNLGDFIEGLPDLLSDRLPGFDPSGAVRAYVRPHFGDFIHRDYVRVPFGARAKLNDQVESSAELQGYFTHGLSDAAGYGLSTLRLGTKCERLLPSLNDAGISIGLNYETPLGRPPIDLSDGHRHLQPYLAATRPIAPKWKLLGYASVSADLLDQTALPAHFGRNQLHTNSLTLTAGVARQWPRFRASLTASAATSSLLSDEHGNVFALRPEIVFPWKARATARTQILFTVGGRAIHGPDGTEFGVSSSMRIDFLLRGKRSAK